MLRTVVEEIPNRLDIFGKNGCLNLTWTMVILSQVLRLQVPVSVLILSSLSECT